MGVMDIIFDYLNQKIIISSGAVLTIISQNSINLLDNDIVTNVLDLFEHIGWLILCIGVLFAIANIYISYLENGSIDLHLFILNLVESFIAIFFLKVGAIEIFKLGLTVNDLIKTVTLVPEYTAPVTALDNYLRNDAEISSVWSLIIGIVAIVIIIINYLQVLKRTGMYIAQIMLGYIYLFSLPSGNTGEFIEWIKQTIAIALTNIIQTSLLFIGLNLMASSSSTIVIGLGILFSASAVENMAGRYGLSTNLTSGLKSNVRSAGVALSRLVLKG